MAKQVKLLLAVEFAFSLTFNML